MQYPDGRVARIGDRVHLWEGAEGVVVCSLDTNEYSSAYSREDWEYLQRGILIDSKEAGLIHYVVPESTMWLIGRAHEAED